MTDDLKIESMKRSLVPCTTVSSVSKQQRTDVDISDRGVHLFQLNLDCMHAILEYLSFFPDRLNLALINKDFYQRWKTSLTSIYSTSCDHLHGFGGGCEVEHRVRFVRKVISHSVDRLSSLSLNGLSIDDSSLSDLWPKLRNLRSLDLSDCRLIGDKTVSSSS